jgi:hypothetical protein
MEHREFAKYFNWCEQNKVRIFPVPITSTGTVLKIAIETNGKIKLGEEKHIVDKKKPSSKISEKIQSLYKEIFLKYNQPKK